jgi:hypothetical protein
MTWLHVPSSALASVRESVDSNWESRLPSPDTELCVSSSGRLSRRPLSWSGWTKRPWVRRLYGTISDPSTAARGVAAWISSLPASPASRSASRATSVASKTNGGSGRTSSACLARFNPDGSFSKTSLDLFDTDSSPSSVDWPGWGTMRSGAVSAREPLERPTAESGSSFSRGEYPTPAATPYGSSQNEGQVAHKRAKEWPSPSARDWKGDPRAPRAEGTGVFATRADQLDRVAERWPTPRAEDGEISCARPSRGVDDTLTAITKAWPSPSATDANGHDYTRDRGKKGAERLALPGTSPSSLPALRTSTCGPECSPKHRRLNPLFVEWLMGWPIGWSSAWTGSAPAVTELSRFKLRTRSSLSRIAPDGWTISCETADD